MSSDLSEEEDRVVLRRATHDLNDELLVLSKKVRVINPEAAGALDRAHTAIFEAWTFLCEPPEDEEDH